VGRINVAQDRDRWRTVVNIIINLWFPKIWGIFGLIEEVLASLLRGVISIFRDTVGCIFCKHTL
jgi:hypothetical protein